MNRFLGFIFLHWAILWASGCLCAFGECSDFTLNVEPIPCALSGGPIILHIIVEYTGEKQIRIKDIGEWSLANNIKSPKEWMKKNVMPQKGIFVGQMPTKDLRRGDKLEYYFPVHKYFSDINPGEHKCSINISIIRTIQREEQKQKKMPSIDERILAKLHGNFTINVEKFTETRMSEYTRELLDKLKSGDETQIIKSLASACGIVHPQMAPIYVEMLKEGVEAQLCFFILSSEIRESLYVLSCAYPESRKVLMDYLTKFGWEQDEFFFELWNKNGLKPSQLELNSLLNARNIEIRIFAGKYLATNDTEWRKSIESQLDDLRARLTAAACDPVATRDPVNAEAAHRPVSANFPREPAGNAVLHDEQDEQMENEEK